MVDGSTIIMPFKVKAEGGKAAEDARANVKVSVAHLGVPPLEPPPETLKAKAPPSAAPKGSARPKATLPKPTEAPKAALAKSLTKPPAREAGSAGHR